MNAKPTITPNDFSYREGTVNISAKHIKTLALLIAEQWYPIVRDIENLVSEAGWASYDDVEVEIEQIRDEFNLNDCTDRYDAAHSKFEEIYSINALAIKTYFEAKKYIF